MQRSVTGLLAGLSLFLSMTAGAQEDAEHAWVDESNRHAQVLLEVMAKYNPEFAASIGVEGHDSEIFDLDPRRRIPRKPPRPRSASSRRFGPASRTRVCSRTSTS